MSESGNTHTHTCAHTHTPLAHKCVVNHTSCYDEIDIVRYNTDDNDAANSSRRRRRAMKRFYCYGCRWSVAARPRHVLLSHVYVVCLQIAFTACTRLSRQVAVSDTKMFYGSNDDTAFRKNVEIIGTTVKGFWKRRALAFKRQSRKSIRIQSPVFPVPTARALNEMRRVFFSTTAT